jgi:glycosyltransferase involved in cell wall biosynthesis
MGPAVLLRSLGFERASRVAAFPDAAIGWVPDAVRRGLRAVRRHRPHVLLSTSAPFSSHLAAMAIHRRTGIPWVADFRDEWAANPALRGEPPLVRRMARRLEQAISSRATALTVVEDYFDILDAAQARRVVIPNGVDEADRLQLAPAPPPGDVLRLSYVGTLYGEQDAGPVFEALQRLVDRGEIDVNRVRVRVVGNDWREPGNRGWPVPVEAIGQVSHRDALQEMSSASALLHYVASASRAPGAKIYEYLASGRPILCVARPDGRAAALVRAANAGQVVSPDDRFALEDAIRSLYERWSTTGLPDQPHARDWVLANYSRRALTGRLADLLDQVSSG